MAGKDKKGLPKKGAAKKEEEKQVPPIVGDFDVLRKSVDEIQKKVKAFVDEPKPDVDVAGAAVSDMQKQIESLKSDLGKLRKKVDDDAKEHRDESRAIVTGVLVAGVIALFLMILTVVIFVATISIQDKEAVNKCEQATRAMEDKFNNLRDYCAEVKAGATVTTTVKTSTTTSATETKIAP